MRAHGVGKVKILRNENSMGTDFPLRLSCIISLLCAYTASYPTAVTEFMHYVGGGIRHFPFIGMMYSANEHRKAMF